METFVQLSELPGRPVCQPVFAGCMRRLCDRRLWLVTKSALEVYVVHDDALYKLTTFTFTFMAWEGLYRYLFHTLPDIHIYCDCLSACLSSEHGVKASDSYLHNGKCRARHQGTCMSSIFSHCVIVFQHCSQIRQNMVRWLVRQSANQSNNQLVDLSTCKAPLKQSF